MILETIYCFFQINLVCLIFLWNETKLKTVTLKEVATPKVSGLKVKRLQSPELHISET